MSKPIKTSVQHTKRLSAHLVTKKSNSCPLCQESHLIYKCKRLLELSVEQRIQEIKSKKLCINCLNGNHIAVECKAGHCKICNRRHNSLLHKPQDSQPSVSYNNIQEVTTTIANHSSNLKRYAQVLLSTALINVLDSKGHKHPCRVLLDSGSQSNIISRKLIDKLELPKEYTQISISGISQGTTNVTYSTCVDIESKQTSFKTKLHCLILEKISECIPLISISREHIDIPKNIKLADPEFHISRDIDMLTGVEIFYKLLCVGQIDLGKNQPLLQKSLFGWLVSGTTTATSISQSPSICNLSTIDRLNQNITKFWELESVSSKPVYSPEERLCEKHFNDTVRYVDCRLVVSIPFKANPSVLGNSRDQALKRFYSLERKLNKNPTLKAEYSSFMKEYLDLGHMRLVSDNSSNTFPNFYLPHHAVIKQNSLTTKVRVVFDGSAKTSSGLSLNDILMTGPKLQHDLIDIVARFRLHKYVLTADVTKMYRQINITEEHKQFQRILWRENNGEAINTYELITVTYGTASASYLAIKALQQLAINSKNTYPLGSELVLRDFYVDDLLTGANTIADARKIRDEVIQVLSLGKLELRKWASNDPALLQDIAQGSETNMILNLDNQEGISTLGLQWNPKTDTLQYSTIPVIANKISKRQILSHISQIFDPLGLLSPVIVRAKILMQEIWQLKINWDESLPLDIQTNWLQYAQDLKNLGKLQIPRHILTIQDPQIYEIHGFCDASEQAYGACVYIRAVNNSGDISMNLLCSKSKAAPLKVITLPRLELCGAALLCQLTKKVLEILPIHFSKRYYWTDSQIVLAWIKSPSKTWKTFVANRVGEIQDLSDPGDWYYVGTKQNPADIASRGTPLLDNKLWWTGPEWLNQDIQCWPLRQVHEDFTPPECKTNIITTLNVSKQDWDIFYRFSSLQRLIRVVAYCQRFANNIRAGLKKDTASVKTDQLSTAELKAANIALVKITQSFAFNRELNQLSNNGELANKGNILCLNPFIDAEGVLRVGGRLKHSSVPYPQKHHSRKPSIHRISYT